MCYDLKGRYYYISFTIFPRIVIISIKKNVEERSNFVNNFSSYFYQISYNFMNIEKSFVFALFLWMIFFSKITFFLLEIYTTKTCLRILQNFPNIFQIRLEEFCLDLLEGPVADVGSSFVVVILLQGFYWFDWLIMTSKDLILHSWHTIHTQIHLHRNSILFVHIFYSKRIESEFTNWIQDKFNFVPLKLDFWNLIIF